MITYFDCTTHLREYLLTDVDINSVVIGDINAIDTNKQTMFPTSFIDVTLGTPKPGVATYNVTIAVMDIVDVYKEDVPKDHWKGSDNRQYILNTMYAVLENLERYIRKGALSDIGWQIVGDMNVTPFEDRLGNLLVGWSADFTVDIPNTVQNCYTTVFPAGLDEILDNELI